MPEVVRVVDVVGQKILRLLAVDDCLPVRQYVGEGAALPGGANRSLRPNSGRSPGPTPAAHHEGMKDGLWETSG